MGLIIKFSSLKSNLFDLLQGSDGSFSIYISTEDGDIKFNENIQRKAASLAKIPILVEAFQQIEAQTLQANQPVLIEDSMMVGGSGIIANLTDANRFTYINLLELMIIVSDNTAANIMLDAVGMDAVNQLIRDLDCADTTLKRKFMDEKAQAAGIENCTSAADIMTFLKIVSEPNVFITNESRTKITEILSNQQFRDKLAYYLPEDSDMQIFHKSGELAGIEHEAAIFEFHGKRLQAVILSEGWINNGSGKQKLAEIGRLIVTYIQSN